MATSSNLARGKRRGAPRSLSARCRALILSGERVVGSVAHDAIDGCTYGLAPVVFVDRRADRLVFGQLGGRNHDLFPEDFRERADPGSHLVEDLRLYVGADNVTQRGSGQVLGDVQRSAAPHDALRRRQAGRRVGDGGHRPLPSGGRPARRTSARPPSGQDSPRGHRWVRCRAWRQSPRVLKSSWKPVSVGSSWRCRRTR